MRVSRSAAWSVTAMWNDVAILDTAEFGAERSDDGFEGRLAYMLTVVNGKAADHVCLLVVRRSSLWRSPSTGLVSACAGSPLSCEYMMKTVSTAWPSVVFVMRASGGWHGYT